MNKKILIASVFATLMLLVPMTSVGGVISKNVTMDNQPPNPPRIYGPTRGKVGVSYIFSFVTTDPDGDNVSYYIDWGDGASDGWTDYIESGQEISYAHTWTKKGKYLIRCKANDTHGAESDWATFYGFNARENKTATYVTTDNQPPSAPIIRGPKWHRVGVEYEYTFNATDPDGDNVSYIINWDDGNTEGWTAWYASGKEIIRKHTYAYMGDFTIVAKAKDIHGAVGPEGYFIVRWRVRNKLIFPNMFPILRHLLRL